MLSVQSLTALLEKSICIISKTLPNLQLPVGPFFISTFPPCPLFFFFFLILSFFLGHRERSSNLPPTQILQVGSIAKYKTRDPGRMTLKGLSLWSLVC